MILDATKPATTTTTISLKKGIRTKDVMANGNNLTFLFYFNPLTCSVNVNDQFLRWTKQDLNPGSLCLQRSFLDLVDQWYDDIL